MKQIIELKSTIIQTYIFDKKKFTETEAKKWLQDHDKHSGKVDENESSYRFRQIEPEKFDPNSFRTIEIEDGIKAVIGKLKNTEIQNIIPELKNSFSWVQESLTDRIPRQLKKHGFDENDSNLHVYLIVALHPLQNLKKEFGIVDLPRDQVLKSTYAAIDRGVNNINHRYKTDKQYKNIILDAEYESERQEYAVASNDPEIFKLVQDGFITAVSIQGTPRVYLEQCSNCIGDLCQCKLIPKGFVLGVADGDALAWVMTKDGQYNGQKIPGEPPADKNTSIEIMMTDSQVQTISLTDLNNTPRHKLHELISNNSFKDSSKNLHMAEHDPNEEEERRKKMEEMNQTITKLTADFELIKNSVNEVKASVTEVQNSAKEVKATIDTLKDTSTKLTEIQTSIKSLVATDEEAKKKFEAFEKDKKNLLEEVKNQNTPVKLTEEEIRIAKEAAIKNTPMRDFIK